MTQLIPITESGPREARDSVAPSSRSGLRLLCRLGQGGMAEVHLAARANASGASDLVVIKRMHQQHVDDAATVRMFLDEARLALALMHPNIVRTQRLGMFGGRHGIVMEFLEGQPFHHVLKRAYEVEGTVNLDLIVQVAIAALDGLHYAHELKGQDGTPLRIIHRDISPQNLFITYDGAVKLLDFGIAKNALQDGRTRTGMLKGKLSYMAPEQARGEAIDHRADIWSLGVMLWEAVTGSRLFKGSNEAATLNMTLTHDITPPSQLRSDLPAELEAILMRALQREPAKRYASAAAMRDDLETWLTGRAFDPDGMVSGLMQRLFADELAAQHERINGLLRAPPDPEQGPTLSSLSGTVSGLRATQMSSVTDLMQELTRQRRTTTRLMTALVAIFGSAVIVALYLALLGGSGQSTAPPVATVAQAATARTRVEPVATPVAPSPGGTASAAVPEALARVARPTSPTRSASHAANTPAKGSARRAAAPASEVEQPPEVASALQTGSLNFDSSPWSIVSVGGRVLGQTPIVGASLPAGTHTLVLSNPEFGIKTTYSVNISAGRTTARRIGLD